MSERAVVAGAGLQLPHEAMQQSSSRDERPAFVPRARDYVVAGIEHVAIEGMELLGKAT